MARKLVSEDVDSDRYSQAEESDAEQTETGGRLLNRRDYVKLSAATAGTVLASSGLGSAAVTRHGIRFDRVVNAVDDLGMDPNGNDPIDSALSDAHETGTLIEFPEGDYRVNDELVIGPRSSKSRFGMVGLGDSHKDVQFHFPNADTSGSGFWFIHQKGGEDCVLANFSIQMTDDDVTSINVRFDCADGGLIQDVEWLGFVPSKRHSYGQLLTCHIPSDAGGSADGVNTLRRVTIGRGGAYLGGHYADTGDNPGTTYIRVYPNHIGEIVVEDAHLEQSGGNALRSTMTTEGGVVTVKGGLFKNNDLSNIRLQGGNHPTKVSTVTGARIVVDHGDAPRPTHGTNFYHGNGVLIDSTEGDSGVVFEGCEFECNEVDLNSGYKPWGLIRLTNTGGSNPGGFTMRNCQIYNATRNQTLWIQSRKSGADDPSGVTLESVDVTVDNDYQTEGSVCTIGDDRDGSRISNCCIHAPNGSIDGVVFKGSSDVVVEDSNVNVSGKAVDLMDSDGNVRNLTRDGSCSLSTSGDLDNEDGTDDETSDSGAEDDGSTEGWHSFVIRGVDSSTRSEYEFIVDGDARENTDLSEYGTVSTVESLDDGTVRVAGSIYSGVDAFDYDGSVVSYTAGTDMEFERDGETITREAVVDGERTTEETDSDSTDTEGWHSFVIRGVDSSTRSEYEFIVDGDARENTDLSEYGTVSTVESLDDGTVRVAGSIYSGVDAFDYDGSVVSYTAGTDMEFERDGETITREAIVDRKFERSLRVVGTGSTSTYELVTDGDIATAPACNEACIDTISGSRAGGEVSSGAVKFLFNGTVAEFSLEGEAGVYLDGKQVDPELLGTDADPVLDNWFTVDGVDSETSYQFSVSGSLHKSPDLGPVEADDVISDGMVIGSVTDEVDGYRFSGELTMMRIQGTADLEFNET
ncbi:hypothetical protein [Halorubrum salsamenti]|uniref:hypothetical protein n=1 Tax=Halorubrum salsamenti TaxID=2583990 RepID=UPI0011A2B681|nr:hypothetical protein [Halorubrum salsamenti]